MIRRSFLIVLSLFVLAACGDGDSTGPSSSITGTYQLQSIEGQSLPLIVYEEEGEKLEIIGGDITLNENNTFSASWTFQTTADGEVTTGGATDTGTYTQTESTLQFSSEHESSTGTLSGNTLTVVGEGATLIYKK